MTTVPSIFIKPVLTLLLVLHGLLVMAVTNEATGLDVDADLIMLNGQIRTPAGWQQALAIRHGVIVAVGESNSMEALYGDNTELVDLNGATVLAGLHDSHVHPLFAGLEQYSCVLEPAASPRDIAVTLRKCAKNKRAGEWLLGGNWVGAVFKPGEQNKSLLDAMAPDNPVVLTDEMHHSAWLNSIALSMAGIDRNTANPEGGIIERDSTGEPTGLLRESAVDLVDRVIPPVSEEVKRAAIILASNQMLSFGITSYTFATIRPHKIKTMSVLSRQGLVKQRVRGCTVWAPAEVEKPAMGEELIANREVYRQPRFTPDCVKIFTDGVPTDSHTAAMLEPYADAHKTGNQNWLEKGLLLVPQSVLNEAVSRFDRQGLHIKFHANGNAAVRAALDAVAFARHSNGAGGPMHDLAHNSFVEPVDIPRVRELNMSWEFSPYIWYPTPITAEMSAAVGSKLMQRFMPVREALQTGALVVAGSDWPGVPSVNPWLGMETMITRQRPGGSDEKLNTDQGITLEQAYRIFTHNGAILMGHRNIVGSIEPGMRADLIVTEKNPFNVVISQLHKTKVKQTYIDGEKVFDVKSPPRLTP